MGQDGRNPRFQDEFDSRAQAGNAGDIVIPAKDRRNLAAAPFKGMDLITPVIKVLASTSRMAMMPRFRQSMSDLCPAKQAAVTMPSDRSISQAPAAVAIRRR